MKVLPSLFSPHALALIWVTLGFATLACSFADDGSYSVSYDLIDGRKYYPSQGSSVELSISCGPDNYYVGFIPRGMSTPALLPNTSLLHFVLMQNSPPMQSKLTCPTRDRSDKFSTLCHTLKRLQVILSVLPKLLD